MKPWQIVQVCGALWTALAVYRFFFDPETIILYFPPGLVVFGTTLVFLVGSLAAYLDSAEYKEFEEWRSYQRDERR